VVPPRHRAEHVSLNQLCNRNRLKPALPCYLQSVQTGIGRGLQSNLKPLRKKEMILDTNILLVIAAVQAVFISFVSVEFARHTGPKGVKNASIIAMVVSFILGCVLSTPEVMLFGVLAFAVPTGILSWLYGEKFVADGIRKQIEMAPQVVSFGLRNYERFAGNDGISPAALYTALDEGTIAEDDYEVVKHIVTRMSDIGHVAGTVVMSAPAMHGGAHAIPVYAINRDDLRSYQRRLGDRYARWIVSAK